MFYVYFVRMNSNIQAPSICFHGERDECVTALDHPKFGGWNGQINVVEVNCRNRMSLADAKRGRSGPAALTFSIQRMFHSCFNRVDQLRLLPCRAVVFWDTQRLTFRDIRGDPLNDRVGSIKVKT
jgi:hypothetical protein